MTEILIEEVELNQKKEILYNRLIFANFSIEEAQKIVDIYFQ
jgi:hypothetical protein